ncbi:MAG: pyruvate carboxylase subunit B [Candidatus Hydrogenedentota bacterium]
MKKRKINIIDVTLRDAYQCIKGTQLTLSELIPIAYELSDIGVDGAEVWGGDTFDACLRYLFEDPWERLKRFREILKNTRIRVLLRGQNIFGYKHYPDDILERFIKTLKNYKVDIIRTYDPLNDIRNVEKSVLTAKEVGMEAEVALIYWKNPLYDTGLFIEKARYAKELGADSICIKDLTGTLDPKLAYTLVYNIRKEVGIPVSLHCNSPGGIASSAYVFGVIAGADTLDCAISPLAIYSNQPALETIIDILENMKYTTELTRAKVFNLARAASKVAFKHMGDTRERTVLNFNTIMYGLPTGLLSNIISHLDKQGFLERTDEVLREVRIIEKELGYPPLIAPISHIVGLQAVSNVLTGERYKIVPKEISWYLRGWYGRPSAEISKDVIDKVFPDKRDYDPINVRPADLLKSKYQEIKNSLSKELIEKDEDYLTYALFPALAMRFFKYREDPGSIKAAEQKHDESIDPLAASALRLKKLSEWMTEHNVVEISLDEGEDDRIYLAKSETREYPFYLGETFVKTAESVSKEEKEKVVEPGTTIITSPMAGVFYRSPAPGAEPFVIEGSRVNPDTSMCIIEAMKLFNEIKAECSGVVVKILVENEQPVIQGQELFYIKKD